MSGRDAVVTTPVAPGDGVTEVFPDNGDDGWRTARWRWRPTVRGVLVGLTALGCLIIGVGGAYPLSTTFGAALLAVAAVDAITLLTATWWWRRLTPTRWIAPNPVHAGDIVTVSWDQADHPLLRGDIDQPLPPSLQRLAPSDPAHLWVRTTRRGLIDLPDARVARLGLFALSRATVGFAPAPQLVVWPAVAALDEPRLARFVQEDAGHAGLLQPNPDDSTVRDYNPGDEFRRIDWRASARRGHLMTRAEEPARLSVAWLHPVVEETAGDQAVELALALAASLVVALGQTGWELGLTTPRAVAQRRAGAGERGGSAASGAGADAAEEGGGTAANLVGGVVEPVVGYPERLLDALAALQPLAGEGLVAWALGGVAPDVRPESGQPARRVALTVLIVAPGPATKPPDRVWPAPGAALALLVGAGAGIAGGAWLERLDRAGWAPVVIDAASPLDQAALRTGRAVAAALRGVA